VNLNNKYVHIGCGQTTPKEWLNFDGSYALKLQRLPVIGYFFKQVVSGVFPRHVKYADVRKKLPVKNNTLKAIYNSHMLMQLTPVEIDRALINMYEALEENGVLRIIVPDLKAVVDGYLWRTEFRPLDATLFFNRATVMALPERPKGIKKLFEAAFGFSRNAWLMDEPFLRDRLLTAGFKKITQVKFNDSIDPMFKLVEKEDRFNGAICLQAIK
jgi:hypothetical protein